MSVVEDLVLAYYLTGYDRTSLDNLNSQYHFQSMINRPLFYGLALWLAASPAWSSQYCLPLGPDLEKTGWEMLTFENKKPSSFAGTDDGTIEVVSNSSVSVLFHTLPKDLDATAPLSWQWKVTETPGATDLTKKGGDDRPLALYLSYPYNPASATMTQKLQRILVEKTKGPDAPGKVLQYVWGGKADSPAVFNSPYMGSSGPVLIKKPGDKTSNSFIAEQVDPAMDYHRIFGEKPLPPMQVAIVSDSDDTGSIARAAIRNICFGKP